MKANITKDEAIKLLKTYNKENFHLKHAVTVGKLLKYFAKKENEDTEFWELVGLLHDLDFEMYPNEHCKKCIEIFKENNISNDFIRAVVSHGYMNCSDIAPKNKMEKFLYAVDELSGLIGAAALMRPSKSVSDMNLKSLKKKYKDKKFALGCSREVINRGSEFLDIEIDKLLEITLEAMKIMEEEIEEDYKNILN